jgi:peptidylprolyl isomerase
MKSTFIFLIILFSYQILLSQSLNNYQKSKSGLEYQINKPGNSNHPQNGDRIWVNYEGRLTNDSVFASTRESGNKDFFMGQVQIIKGWEEGLKMIGEGGKISLRIPAGLGYGKMKIPGIPPNSTLIFEIELLQVDRGKPIEPFNIKGLKAQKSEGGLTYYVLEPGNGPKAKINDNAYVHYTGWLPDGTIYSSSRNVGNAVRITVGAGDVIEGWDLGLQLMSAGSKIRFEIPAKLAFGKEGYGNRVPPNSKVYLDLEMVSITPEIKVRKWDASGKDTLITPSGLKYIVFVPGTGDLIKPDNLVTVDYSGYFTDGKLFDSSVKREEPLKFPVGAGFVIDGWDEAIQLMRLESKFQLIVPARLAYGEAGSLPEIPANADLIFDIEVLDVMK